MKTYIYMLAFVAGAFVSCNHVPMDKIEQSATEVTTIYASVESDTSTKTMIDNTTLKITWTSGDAINVFFGASESSRFVTAQSGSVAQFKGSIDVVTGGGEGLTDDTSLWGVYPYNAGNSCDGSLISLTLPADQEAAENTFAKGLFPQIARSQNFYMSFYNLCGSFRFTVESPDIRYVTIEGNDSETIAGKVKVSMTDVPRVEEIITEETKLTMYAPGDGCFTPGVNYYFVLFPTTFTDGLTITYYKEDTHAAYVYPKSYTLGRGVVSRFSKKDSELTFVPTSLNDWESGEKIEGEI